MLNELLKNNFIGHYGITNKNVSVDYRLVRDQEFDLKDMSSPFDVLPFGAGEFSLKGNDGEMEIVHYEDFVNQCKKPRSLVEGRKRCDYVLCSSAADDERHVLLVEITSASGNVENLKKPIFDKNGEVQFGGGKFEKGEQQLSVSLETLMDVPEIKAFVDGFADKQCLLSYRVLPKTAQTVSMPRPMRRYLDVEAKETRGKGAVLTNTVINGYGFTYRRLGSYLEL